MDTELVKFALSFSGKVFIAILRVIGAIAGIPLMTGMVVGLFWGSGWLISHVGYEVVLPFLEGLFYHTVAYIIFIILSIITFIRLYVFVFFLVPIYWSFVLGEPVDFPPTGGLYTN